MADKDDSTKLNTNVSSFRKNGLLNQVVKSNIRYTGDGVDCFDKAIGYGVTGSVFGTLYGAMYIALAYEKPEPVPYHPAIRHFVKLGTCTVTFAGASFMYAVASCSAASIREKDDYKNHLLGGFGAGAIIGAKFRSPTATIVSGILIGVTTASFSYLNLQNGVETFVPDTMKHIPDNRYGWQSPVPKDIHSPTISSKSKKDLNEWYESKKQL